MKSNRHSYEGLFSKELNVLQEAQAFSHQLPSSQEEILSKYSLLTDYYAKLLKTAMKLSRIGDIQGKSLANQNRRLKHQSETDFLTGLYNVRKLQETIPAWAASGQPFVLLLLDIDYFKNVNDNYGHLSGDEVLKALASILNEQTRYDHLVYRTGGEEFSILLVNTRLLEAETIAQRIRKKVEDSRLHLPTGEMIGVTVSIGLVEYASGMSSEQLLGCADDALYLSKGLGRNKVTLYPKASGKRNF